MATRDTYTKVHEDWKGRPDKTTPVMPEDLEHIEQGIKDAMDNRALKEIYDDDAINLGRRSGTSVGSHSTAEGNGNLASGQNSHAEGMNTESSGFNSHAEGYGTKATASGSHAENGNTEASGTNSHAEGMGTKAIGYAQHVSGKYNQPNNNLAAIVGGGTSDSDRKNIHTLDWAGNAYFSGDVTNGSGVSLNSLKSAIDNIPTGGGATAKVFDTKADLDAWLAVEGNADTLVVGQNIYITETDTPDYWWDGTSLQILETDTVVIESMTYDETTTALNSQEMGEINKIPNVYAIRDWCKSMMGTE